MFVRLEELVLANSGEDEFEEVLKLVIAKLWDERQGNNCFRAYTDCKKTYEVISSLLHEAGKTWPGIVEGPRASSLTPEHLQVCVESFARHTILDNSLEVIDSFFEFMVAKTAKGSKGQYFTPRYVIEFCVRMLEPKSHELVLDPACGSGGFLFHTLDFVRERESLSPKEITEYCGHRLWGFDIDARAIRVAKALMVLAGDGKSNLIRLNSLLHPENSLPRSDSELVLTIEDVSRSRMRKHKGFDVILTNPPFAGEVREQNVLNQYAVARGKSRMERDVLFVERCVQLLKPGGRMAIVLPHNKVAADSCSVMREWLLQKTHVLAVVGLGRNTFLPHTHQKASIVFVKKREEVSRGVLNDPIFFAVSERDGKNSRGQIMKAPGVSDTAPLWSRVDHDLAEVVNGFHDFCRSENVEAGGM